MNMITVNALGKACPLPVIEAKKAVESLPEGGIVEVLVDNEIAVQNVSKLAVQRHLTYHVSHRDEGYAIELTVPAGAVPTSEAPAPVETCAPSGGIVVAIGAATMGVGDDTLGRLLMKSFLFALTKQDELPQTILFYNGGAHLTCEGSEYLEDLAAMAEAGVEILTCGTCLNHYGISDKLAVGGVTNMYEIVAKQAAAGRVIRP